MLDNQDNRGEQRIFVITGERLRDLWQAKIDAMKAAAVRLAVWGAEPGISADEKLGFDRTIKMLNADIAAEEFAVQFIAMGNVRMSPREIQKVYALTRNPPVVDMTKEALQKVYGEVGSMANQAMAEFKQKDPAITRDDVVAAGVDVSVGRTEGSDPGREENNGALAGMPTPLT